ncbi:MAG: hypothetical protein KDH19_14960 [Geminicoccaceae bacterium]|nr:hypothetical protein [Geminicoccaceae bacterium]
MPTVTIRPIVLSAQKADTARFGAAPASDEAANDEAKVFLPMPAVAGIARMMANESPLVHERVDFCFPLWTGDHECRAFDMMTPAIPPTGDVI